MLLQSYAGFIEVMPALPAAWQDVSFNDLRAEGAFLVSAKKVAGEMAEVKIVSEKGGSTKLKMPFVKWGAGYNKGFKITDTHDGFITLTSKPGAVLVLKNVPK